MTKTTYSVSDRVAVVTGASRGIGQTIAERFVKDGADVVLCSRSQADVDEVAASIAENGTGDTHPVECDVTDRESVDALVRATIEEFDSFDILVNNAGGSFASEFEKLSENAWKTIVDINLHGTFNCLQSAGEVMRDGDGGVIVNIASNAGLRGAPALSHYGAAKAGVINLTATLAHEWAGDDVRVNAIAPGVVATPGIEEQLDISATSIDRDSVDRRIGTTDEIADVVQFLASPAASYVIGETIPVRGVPQIDGIGTP
ncbi:SDR family NAD(P)-dependent oxidoreductase [Natrinema halophilum]|uniref:SDR family NAD(P)-dependent oxidoreductase n=1 Tax=Natrinema halophilum TaxID=1699371 RepID=UPI001F38C55B|nr:glucose 1-dehydrogenase [Natrinema halophilum]UHQ96203.1 glucose 1-dehydrogenase [Natrinema halophilum]